MSQENKEREFNFTKSHFSFLSELASSKTGIMLASGKKDMVYSRLVRRLRALQLASFDDYCALLQGPQGVEELDHLINAITTNLTSFFRESHHFDHLRQEVLPQSIKEAKDKKIRIWSAGCSSGMEPYTIAMILKNAKIPASLDTKILATDIDTNMLATAKNGIYPSSQYEKIPPAFRPEVLVKKNDEQIMMSDHLKSYITFNQLNLLESWPFKGPFDAVFCRNVVIYFDKKTQATLFSRIAQVLKPNAWLYLGHSENLYGVSNQFELVGRTIYRKRS